MGEPLRFLYTSLQTVIDGLSVLTSQSGSAAGAQKARAFTLNEMRKLVKNVRLTTLTLVAILASSLTVTTGQSAAVASSPRAGTLDTSFNSRGLLPGVETTTLSGFSAIGSLALDKLNRIVVGGISENTFRNFTLARYNADGGLDSTFGVDGVETTTIGSGDSNLSSIAIDSLGRIVAGGSSYDGVHNNFTLARYTPEGRLDTSFGIYKTGIETSTIGTGESQITSIAIDGSDKIVAGGYSNDGSHNNFTLARYNTDGAPDLDFGTESGVETSTISSGDNQIASIAIASSGTILTGGSSFDGSYLNFTLARYTARGHLDNSFGTHGTGVETSTIGSDNSHIQSIAIDNQSRILAGGYDTEGSHRNFALARYSPNGSLDKTFAKSGVETSSICDGFSLIGSIAIDRSGKILAGGYSSIGSHDNFTLARYNTDGGLDTTFGTNGVERTTIGTGDNLILNIKMDSSGRIVAGGFSTELSRVDFALARYNGDPVNSGDGGAAARAKAQADADAAAAAAKAQQDHDTALALGTLALAIGSVESGLSTLTLAATKGVHPQTAPSKKKSKKLKNKAKTK